MITHLDAQLGRVFQALKDTGDYDNTIIIFASDQGIAIGSHGLMGKQNLYEHSMGVPLIFSGPGIPKGRKAEAFAYLFDVFPTVCDLVGAPVPKGLEGKSLAPILRGQAQGVRDTVFLAYRSAQRAARRGRWKLIQYPQINTTQLFDLADDPAETNNLASHPAHAGKVKELMAIMAEQQKLFGDTLALKSDAPRPGKVDLTFFERALTRQKHKEARKTRKRKK
jgi:arylsulfatase A-like enzyme